MRGKPYLVKLFNRFLVEPRLGKPGEVALIGAAVHFIRLLFSECVIDARAARDANVATA
jgi:hypothetical protein